MADNIPCKCLDVCNLRNTFYNIRPPCENLIELNNNMTMLHEFQGVPQIFQFKIIQVTQNESVK